MALSIVELLITQGSIQPDPLAALFARRFVQQPWRGYGGGAQQLLNLYAQGADWRQEAARLFNGGSYGNGAAMRAAPIGAFFASQPEQAAAQTIQSAQVTHAHEEGQAGAVAVAVAAALTAKGEATVGPGFLNQVMAYVPSSRTRDGIQRAAQIEPADHHQAVSALGTGQRMAAFDTVPYCLWVAAHHAHSFEGALWTTVAGLGDRDTTCAIVGGIVALKVPVPGEWLKLREPLPDEILSLLAELP